MRKYILPATAVICIAAVVCMICALTIKNPADNAFTPPDFDAASKRGTPTVSNDQGYSNLDAKAFKVSVCGKLFVKDDNVVLFLTNPESNNVWLKVRILDEGGNILGETGLTKPGEYVETLTLDTVPKQSSAVKLKIMAYEPDTYYSAGSASLNTTLTIE